MRLAVLLLGLLAFGQLAAPAAAARHARKRMLLPADQAEQAQREAQQEQAMLAEQRDWEAQEQARIAAQQQAEAAKLEEMADTHAVREQQQEAAQLEEAAEKAVREQAATVEQQQLADKARQAEREAAEAAARKAEEDAAEAAEEAARQAAQQAERDIPAGGAAAARTAAAAAEAAAVQAVAGAGSQADSPRRSRRAQPVVAGPAEVTRGARGGTGSVYTTYHYYAPAYETSSLYCADVFQAPGYDKASLLDLPWTAYCNNAGLGPMTLDKCGKCLKVTNPATGQSVRMKVVDMCGQGGIDADPKGFNAIDGDGAGVRNGHMLTEISWC